MHTFYFAISTWLQRSAIQNTSSYFTNDQRIAAFSSPLRKFAKVSRPFPRAEEGL